MPRKGKLLIMLPESQTLSGTLTQIRCPGLNFEISYQRPYVHYVTPKEERKKWLRNVIDMFEKNLMKPHRNRFCDSQLQLSYIQNCLSVCPSVLQTLP